MSESGLRRAFPTITPTTAAPVGLTAALLIVFVANYHVPKGENGGLWPAVVTGVGCLVVAAIVFGVVLPRHPNTERTALVFGILAILSIVVFWSGITPVLAAASAASGETTSVVTRVIRVLAGIATMVVIVAVVAGSHLG